MGPLIVVILRLIVPLSIFKNPLLGGVLSMLLDAIDVVLIDVIDQGNFSNYHQLDKYLDIYYLSFELIMLLKFKSALIRRTAIFLFVYRFIGFLLFEFSQIRIFLFLFPNLFENFFLFVFAYKHFFDKEISTYRGLILILLILLIPKMAQEYLLHFAEAKPWNWFKDTIWWYK